MTDFDYNISDSEWDVMRIIWTLGPTHVNKVLEQLQDKNGWSDSTIKTLMRRLVKKGLLKTQKDSRRFLYSATVNQKDMMKKAADNMLSRMCDMHKGGLLIDLVKEVPLSQSDIAQLQEVLAQKAKTAPARVACNCLTHRKGFC